MRRAIFVTPLVLGFVAAAATPSYADCTCSVAKVKNGWCKDCKVGYFATVKLKSKELFKAVDGHDVDADAIKCGLCKKAFESDGYCPDCKLGFVGKKKYHSTFAYHLAGGKVKDASGIKCSTCKKNAESHGWCDACGIGMAGHLAYKDKKMYKLAETALDIVTSAAKAATKCVPCAVAMVTNGTCDACDVAYKDGEKIATKTP